MHRVPALGARAIQAIQREPAHHARPDAPQTTFNRPLPPRTEPDDAHAGRAAVGAAPVVVFGRRLFVGWGDALG